MSESNAEYFARLGQRFAQVQDEQLSTRDARPAARARLFDGAPRASSARLVSARSGWTWRFALVPALALVAGALLLWGTWGGRTAPLTFVVGAQQGQAGQLLAANADTVVPLRFSDGSVLELTPQTRSRVLNVAPNGARVELERGVMQASVVHRADTTWAVLAGPFQVAVTGTKFTTRWEPLQRELEVIVQEGSVLVSGGTLRAPERVSQGKTLRVVIAPVGPQATTLSVETPRQTQAAPQAVDAAAPKPPASANKSPSADPDAFRAVFDSGSPTDLVTLSKELRQRGDARGATRALLALRSRFPNDPRSLVAAHTLAEMALGRRDCGEAERWLQAYVARAPASAASRDLQQRVQACAAARSPRD